MLVRDFLRLVLFLLLGLSLGAMLGHTVWGLFFGSLAYILHVHASLRSLLQWLRDRKNHQPPEQPGVFEDLTIEVDYLRERHKKRKKKRKKGGFLGEIFGIDLDFD